LRPPPNPRPFFNCVPLTQISVRCAHKLCSRPLDDSLGAQLECAPPTSFRSSVAGRARLPTLSPNGEPRAASGHRASHRRGTLPFARGGDACSGRMSPCIPSPPVIVRFQCALRAAGIPHFPISELRSKKTGAAPAPPKTNGSSTTRLRLRFSPSLRGWACAEP